MNLSYDQNKLKTSKWKNIEKYPKMCPNEEKKNLKIF